jgi:hypothetical protein
MPTTKTDNLDLWNRHEKTDPAMTKKVTQRGGFTAICAMHQMKEATKEWGPYGKAWGLGEMKYEYVRNGQGEIVEVSLEAMFGYPGGGSFGISTDIAYRPGNDSRKKLRTDCITKALSNLGFNADVFMGKFDDNKYVNEMNELFGNNGKPPPAGSQRDEAKKFLDGKPADKGVNRAAFEAAINVALRRDVPMCPPPTEEQYTAWGRAICQHNGFDKIPDATAWVEQHARFKPVENLKGEVTGAEQILEPTT